MYECYQRQQFLLFYSITFLVLILNEYSITFSRPSCAWLSTPRMPILNASVSKMYFSVRRGNASTGTLQRADVKASHSCSFKSNTLLTEVKYKMPVIIAVAPKLWDCSHISWSISLCNNASQLLVWLKTIRSHVPKRELQISTMQTSRVSVLDQHSSNVQAPHQAYQDIHQMQNS